MQHTQGPIAERWHANEPRLGDKSVANWKSRLRQLQYCNFWPRAQADWGTGGSDAAVDVQLAAAFFVPSADVGSLRVHEGEAPVDERERQLAAVAVPSQRQVDA